MAAADFRAYVQQTSPNLLGYVGNDVTGQGTTGINTDKLRTDTLPLADTNSYQNDVNSIDSLYNQYVASLGGGSSTSAGSGAANTDASDLAYLDDQDSQLQRQLASTNGTLNDGITQLEDSYNENANRTNQDQASADSGFDTTRTNTTQDKLKSVDTLNTNARSLSDSVRRVLGLAGGANSSAYLEVAPNAIATDTTQKRSDVNDTYSRNFKSIDDSQSASDLKFSRALQDLSDQRKQKEEGLRSGVLQQEQSIQAQLGNNALQRAEINGGSYGDTRAALAPYSSAIADRQSAIDGLFSQFRTPYTLADTTPVAPTLGDYTTDPTTVALNGDGNAASADDSSLSPYLAALQKKFSGATTT